MERNTTGVFENYPVISVQKLADGEEAEILNLKKCFTARGWAFVSVDEQSAFCSEKEDVKREYCHGPRYGFVKTDAKEAFRMLTKNMSGNLMEISNWFDETISRILEKTSKLIFDVTPSQMVSEKQLTLLDPSAKYGMLDLVTKWPLTGTLAYSPSAFNPPVKVSKCSTPKPKNGFLSLPNPL